MILIVHSALKPETKQLQQKQPFHWLLLIKMEGFCLLSDVSLWLDFLKWGVLIFWKSIGDYIRKANVIVKPLSFVSIFEHNSSYRIIIFSTLYSRDEKWYDKNRNYSASICYCFHSLPSKTTHNSIRPHWLIGRICKVQYVTIFYT